MSEELENAFVSVGKPFFGPKIARATCHALSPTQVSHRKMSPDMLGVALPGDCGFTTH